MLGKVAGASGPAGLRYGSGGLDVLLEVLAEVLGMVETPEQVEVRLK